MSRNDRIVLDTSAWSHLRRGHPGVLDRIQDAAVVLMPVTVLGELEAGFALGRRRSANQRDLAEFLREPFVGVLDLTARTVPHYARIYAALRRAGTPIPINDVWIAAATMECGGSLLTLDRDFLRVEGLERQVLDPP